MFTRQTTCLALLTAILHPQFAGSAEPPSALEARLLSEGIPALAEAVEAEGDPRRGAVLFHQRSMACNRCHATGNGTSPLGPDLTEPNPKMTAAHIVESILVPSKVIDKAFQAVQVVREDGRIVTGIVQEGTREAVKLLLPLETGKVVTISRKEIDDIFPSRVSLMPVGQVNQLADRSQFLDLARYVFEVATHGPEIARELQPDGSELQSVHHGPIDHAATIAKLAAYDLNAGRELYTNYCVNCHGKDGNKTLNPLARRFAKDPLKFGTDPYSMWKTISYGNGLMFPQAALLSPDQRYQVVHYIREQFIRHANPTQYFKPDKDYLAGVNARAEADAEEFGPVKIAVTEGMIDGSHGQQMDYGSYLSHSIAFTKPANKDAARFADTTERALAVQLPGGHVVCYDTERGSVAGIWTGRIAHTEKSHHTSYKGSSCLTPGGDVDYKNVDDIGWTTSHPDAKADSAFKFKGHYLHSGQVLLEYEVAGRRIVELPGILPGEKAAFSRTFHVDPGSADAFCLVGRLAGGKARIDGLTAQLRTRGATFVATVSGVTEDVNFFADNNGGVWLKLPADAQPCVITLWYAVSQDGANALPIPADTATPDFDVLTHGGPRHWPQLVRTRGVLGEPIEGYAADQITIPYANPWGSWMRTTALDFFSDGSAAVSTLSGDVWIVRWNDAELSDITWSRFATGLYEPLGLRIVDDVVYVRGRDRITRLHDRNGDGEADYYECFHQEGEIGANYHAFLFDLQTDRDGNFYFARSGRKSPHEGGVIRVSPDGKSSEVVCHDFRHPNGLGSGGPHDWITVSDNPHGKAVYNGVAIVREGEHYGYESSRTTPMLAVLPPSVDSSSGGQCWADADRWGPLSGHMIHTSYSRLSMFYVITQDIAPHPNGFAVRMPFAFDSGVMRARVHPVDGQVYVVGQKGWDTQARYDGCLYRIRRVESPTHLITDAAATGRGIQLTFSCDIEAGSVSKSNVEVVREEEKGTKPVAISGVAVVDSRTIEVKLPDIEKETVATRTRVDKKTGKRTIDVLCPIRVTVKLRAADGATIEQTLYATINSLPHEQPR